MSRALSLPALLLAQLIATAPAARVEPMTAARIRTLTREAQSAARGDQTEFLLDLDARVRARWGDFESFPISILRRDDVSIILTSPYMTYRRTLAEYVLVHRPIAGVPWIDAIVIAVAPARIDAPDIPRVEVERAGKAVMPLANLLRPMRFSNGSGEEALLHAGEVRFPMSAFAPGALVTVSAIPQAGSPFVTSLSDSELQTLK